MQDILKNYSPLKADMLIIPEGWTRKNSSLKIENENKLDLVWVFSPD